MVAKDISIPDQSKKEPQSITNFPCAYYIVGVAERPTAEWDNVTMTRPMWRSAIAKLIYYILQRTSNSDVRKQKLYIKHLFFYIGSEHPIHMYRLPTDEGLQAHSPTILGAFHRGPFAAFRRSSAIVTWKQSPRR